MESPGLIHLLRLLVKKLSGPYCQ